MVRCNLIKPSTRVVRLLSAGLLFPWITTIASVAEDVSIELAWDSVSPITNAAFYKVHYGTRSRTYTETLNTGHLTTCTVAALLPTQTYYFAATASDILGNTSDYSEELVVDREVPIILGHEDLVEHTSVEAIPRMPELTSSLILSDDVTPTSGLQISQTPPAGPPVSYGDTTVTIQVTDAAGNTAALETIYRLSSSPPAGALFGFR